MPVRTIAPTTPLQQELAAESKALAKEIRRIRQRHQKVEWPKHQGTKRELLEFLRESALILQDAARTLEGKQ